MAEKDNVQLAQKTIAAINDKNIDAYLQLLDNSYVMETEMAPAPLRGHDAVRQMLQSYFNGIPDLKFELEQVIASGDHVVTRTHVTGTHKGTFLGVPATNKKIDVRSCSVTEVRNGKAVHTTVYSQTAKLLEQIGVLALPKAMTARP